ncbi:MAG: hypothetical protein J7J99_05785 [Thermoprotei archaeon]|nr:hypothetical protein [Thermoprotei archaeon]
MSKEQIVLFIQRLLIDGEDIADSEYIPPLVTIQKGFIGKHILLTKGL